MIQKVNWNLFKANFYGQEQKEFERLCYLLFCREFKYDKGIPRFKDHPGIETDPIKKDGKIIGWQAKFYTTKLSEHKADFINSLNTAKSKHPDLNKIIFYTNQAFAQGRKNINPQYKIDIEAHAKMIGVEIEWRTESYFDSDFVCTHNFDIAQHFFDSKKEYVPVFVQGPVDGKELIDFLTIPHSNFHFIQNFLKQRGTGFDHIQSIDQSISLLEALKSSILFSSAGNKITEYDKIISNNSMATNNETINHIIRTAAIYVSKLDFITAHRILGDALGEINSADKLYDSVYKEYLITGFICYSRQNDIKGLKALLPQKAEIGHTDPDTNYIISMIFQEIFSRDIDLKGLRDCVSILDKIYADTDELMKPAIANSLGLAYRRLGERTGISYLEKAISIFEDGLKLNKHNKRIEIELKDQMAITYIRIFEFIKDGAQLHKAEVLLKDCLRLLKGPMDPKDYRLKPRVLNNLGNVYKQRVLVLGDISSAGQALSKYEEAERYWNKKEANYDWALLRKNIAETKYAVGKITSDTKILFEALNDCMQSIQYRNSKNSPYQWAKSVNIAFSLIILLHQLKSLTISKPTRNKIQSYASIIIKDEARWAENVTSQFIQNARQVQALIL